jgi:hypothetical protein
MRLGSTASRKIVVALLPVSVLPATETLQADPVRIC